MLRNVINDSSEIGVREDRVVFLFTLSNPMRLSKLFVVWGNETKMAYFFILMPFIFMLLFSILMSFFFF